MKQKHTSYIHLEIVGTMLFTAVSLADANIIFAAATQAGVSCPSSSFYKSAKCMASGGQHTAFGQLSPKPTGALSQATARCKALSKQVFSDGQWKAYQLQHVFAWAELLLIGILF